jgi:hypothetical protein
MKKIEEILIEHEHRAAKRANFEPMWDEILRLYLPGRAQLYSTPLDQGKEQTQEIYDSTPGVSMLRLAAVLQSMLTNRDSQWMRLATDDEELNEQDEVKRWLEDDLKRLRRSLENSNFYAQAHEMYIDLPVGHGVMFIEESTTADRDLHFSTRSIHEAYLSYEDQDRVEHINVVRTMTARQIMSRWGMSPKGRPRAKVSDKVLEAYEKDPETPFDVLQSVFPNEDFDPQNELDPLKFAFQCVWCELGEEFELDRGGYHEFPYLVVPWAKASGEDYGRGPCWDALPDVRTLYSMRKTQLRVAEKIADPPLQVPKEAFIGSIKLTPGGLNFYDQTSRSRIEPIQIGANFNVSLEMVQDIRSRIQDHFFVNQLQLIDAREMTAEEVRARVAENARILGPTFGRLNDEYLDPLVGRSLGILRRAGKLRPIPDIVLQAARRRGTRLRVKFVSPLAKAQVANEVQGIIHTATTAVQWARDAGDISVLDNLDMDFGIRKIADLDGAPPQFLRDRALVAQQRQQRAKIQQAQMQLQAAQGAAEIDRDTATAEATRASVEGSA